jgi:multidrug transporter EmrE-like cation transporter
MAWAFLVGAGPLEIVWAIALKYTDGFTRFPLVAPRVTLESFEFVFGRATALSRNL